MYVLKSYPPTWIKTFPICLLKTEERQSACQWNFSSSTKQGIPLTKVKIQIIITFKNIQKSFRIKVKVNVQYSFFSVEHCFLKVKIHSVLLLDTVTTNRKLSLNNLYIKCYLTHNLVWYVDSKRGNLEKPSTERKRPYSWHTHATCCSLMPCSSGTHIPPVGPLGGVVLTRQA